MEYFISIPLLLIFPLITGFIIFFIDNPIYLKKIANIFAGIELFYSLMFYLYTPKPFFDFCIDSLSVFMIILTTLIIFISVLSSKLFIRKHYKYFYSLILILESILLGIFTTENIFIFFLLWELELIPMFLLISLFGNKNANNTALKFVLYTFGGGLFLLLGILSCYFLNIISSGVATFNIKLLNLNGVNILLELFISFCFLLAFCVKIPLVPLHLWLADTHTNSSTPLSIILAGVLLKLGVYGIIRFNLFLLPTAFSIFAPILAFFCIANIIYGAAMSYSQSNLKRLIAYSSISQMGLIVLGLCSIDKVGFIGSIFHMFSHGIISAGLFISAGIIKLKFRTYNLKRLSGIAVNLPRLFGFTMFIALAAAGIPFLSGFVGEFLIIYGTISSPIILIKILSIISVVILLLSGLYIMKFLHETFFGPISDVYCKVQDLAVHELAVLASICTIIIVMGCFPSIFINYLCVGG